MKERRDEEALGSVKSTEETSNEKSKFFRSCFFFFFHHHHSVDPGLIPLRFVFDSFSYSSRNITQISLFNPRQNERRKPSSHHHRINPSRSTPIPSRRDVLSSSFFPLTLANRYHKCSLTKLEGQQLSRP